MIFDCLRYLKHKQVNGAFKALQNLSFPCKSLDFKTAFKISSNCESSDIGSNMTCIQGALDNMKTLDELLEFINVAAFGPLSSH